MDWERTMRGARYHEAGHAVAAHHHGYTVRAVMATDEEWGTNWSRPAFGGPADDWRDACVTLAGQFADHVAAWGEVRPEPWEEFLSDAETVREMVEEYGDEDARDDHLEILEHLEEMASYSGDSLETCYLEVVQDTRTLISEHWAEIEAVAHALDQTGILDGPTFTRTMESLVRESADE
jgi:hypothetical protein